MPSSTGCRSGWRPQSSISRRSWGSSPSSCPAAAGRRRGSSASGPGQSHTFSGFVGPIGDDLGLSKAAIAGAYGLATLAAALLLPKMGRLVDSYGPRRMTTIVTLALGLACMAFGAAGGLATLALGFGALRFFGQGSLMMCCATFVAQ